MDELFHQEPDSEERSESAALAAFDAGPDNTEDSGEEKEHAAREEERKFYREVIEKKPSRYGKKALAVFLILGGILGAACGLGIDRFWPDKTPGTKVAYATEVNYTVDKTVSPVVPIAKKVLPSIVAIETSSTGTNFFGAQFESQGTGSGIIIDTEGHIVTNNHVVEGAANLTVILKDGTELSARLVGRDSLSDLAVIQVDRKNLSVAELGDSSQLEVGELAVAIGSPMGTDFAGSVTSGIISGLNREISLGDRKMTLIQTDAAINPGNSGGALVNAEGQVIGINTLKLSESQVEGMGFAIPINEAKPIIDQLIKNKKITRPFLGIQGVTVTEQDAQRYGLPQGVYVGQVVSSSGAEQAGISKGDVITKVDGKTISTMEDLVTIINNHKVGDVLKVEITNQYNRTKTFSVKLQESPAE